jgi:hypothetical protein
LSTAIKAATLDHCVRELNSALALAHGGPEACYVLAQALWTWIRHAGERALLAEALHATLATLGRERAPLFATEAPLPLRHGVTIDALVRRLSDHLGAHDWEASDGEWLGPLFERHLSHDHRKSNGVFYTPRDVVDHVLRHTLPPADQPLSKQFRLIDPSCGAGNFLAPAVEALFERVWVPQTGSEGRILRLKRVIERHVVGVDLDPWAIRLAGIRLAFVQLKLCPELSRPFTPQLLSANTLTEHPWLLEAGFDAVLGNPPYGAEIPSAQKALFQRHYQVGKGRQDTTALFIERSLRLLKEGGRLGFVVPHGVTRTGAYAECRRLLTEFARPVALADLGACFPGVNLETVAFVVEKGKKPVTNPLMLIEIPRREPAVQLHSYREGTFRPLGEQDPQFYVGRPTMPIYANRERGPLIARMEAVGKPLEAIAQIRRGANISARDPLLTKSGDGIPVVRGRDIRRYGPLNGGSLLRLPEGFALRDRFRSDVVTRPKVGYQNIASSVVATLIPEGALPLDTVNVLEPRIDVDPLYLLGLLNSRLLDAYFQLVITNRAQLTLHLDTPTLGSLPIVIPDAGTQSTLGQMAFDCLHWQRLASLEAFAETILAKTWASLDDLTEAFEAFQADARTLRRRIAERSEQIDLEIAALYGVDLEAFGELPPRSAGRRPAMAKELAQAAETALGELLARKRFTKPAERFSELRTDVQVLLEAAGLAPTADGFRALCAARGVPEGGVQLAMLA